VGNGAHDLEILTPTRKSGETARIAAQATVIALHGNGGGGYRFHRVEPYVRQGLALQAVTLPGFGFEARDPAIRGLRGYADWLAREVVSVAPRPVYLLGHGIGGSLACEFVQHYAKLIDGVILHAPVGAALDKRWFPRLMKLPGMRRLAQEMLGNPLLTPLWSRLLFRQRLPKNVLRRFFAEYRACQVFGDLFDWIDAPWFESLLPTPLPAVILWGERERVLRSGQAAAFDRIFPVHERTLVPDWDHFPMLETPEEYARQVERAVDRLQQLSRSSTSESKQVG
jgi:pimeloyl-ACP methyl ester carboxylesterase